MAMLIPALLYASILAALWQYGKGRRLKRDGCREVCASEALVRFEPDFCWQETPARARARVSTRILSIVSHKTFQLRVLGQASCDDGSIADNFTYLSCTGMPYTRLGRTATNTPARESSLTKVFTINALIIDDVD